jgi:hypothetical protein
MLASVPAEESSCNRAIRIGTAIGSGARGDAGLADFTTCHSIWFLQSFYPPAAQLLVPHPGVRAWAARVKEIGHGKHAPMERGEALEIAEAAEPATAPGVEPGEPNG